MKIVMVESTAFPPEEGLGNYVWNLSRHLARANHDVHVFTRGSGLQVETEVVERITVHQIPAPKLYPFHVHLHGHLLHRAIQNKAPDADVYHFHTPLPPAIPVTGPVVLTFHTPVLSNFRALTTWDATSILYRLQTPVSVGIENRLIRLANVVTAVSGSVASDLGRDYGVPLEDITIIENGVDPELFVPPSHPRGDFLLYSGRLGWRKGLFELIDALALLRQRGAAKRLVVTGKGPFRKKLEARAEQIGVADLVNFVGFVTVEELVQMYQQAEMFVFPSHYEGLPTSLLEAMSTGTPIVTTNAPGVRDLVTDGENAVTVDVDDATALASAIEDLAVDPARRVRLGQAARREVELNYSWPRITEKALRTYESVTRNDKDPELRF